MKKTNVRISNSGSLLMGVILSLVPFSLRAQQAMQVVRYSITGVSQGKIDGGSGGSAGSTTFGTSSSGFGSASIPTKATTPSTAVTKNGAPKVSQASVGAASAGPTTTTPVWQASYQISNNEENKKLSISIDAPMPNGMALTADIGAPSGAEATGPVDMATSSLDVVTGIGAGATGALPIEFSLTAAEGKSGDAGSRKVSFTFISGA